MLSPRVASRTALIFFTLASSTLLAETEPPPQTDTSGCHCFAGKPKPACSDFWIVEIGPGVQVATSTEWLEGGTTMIVSDIGFMKNLSRTSSLGLTGFGATDSHRSRAGIRLRYRHWLSPRTSLDLSPGLLLLGDFNGPYMHSISYPSGMATASVTYASRVSAFVGVEFLRTPNWGYYDYNTGLAVSGRDKSTETVLWTGVNAGAEFGVAGLSALLGLLILMAATN
jgi:hypothetical protein